MNLTSIISLTRHHLNKSADGDQTNVALREIVPGGPVTIEDKDFLPKDSSLPRNYPVAKQSPKSRTQNSLNS